MGKLKLEEQISVETPSTNKVAIYPKPGGRVFKKDDTGKDVQLEETNYHFPDSNETDQGVNGNGFSIKDCIDVIGSKKGTIYLKHDFDAENTIYTVSTDLTIPENICFMIENGAIVSVDSGKVLTINGAFEAGLYQVFSGDGSVVFGNRSIMGTHPEWWYDGNGDWYLALNSALTAYSQMYLVSNIYTYNTSLVIPHPKTITGCGIYESILKFDGSGVAIIPNSQFITLQGFQISAGTGAHTSGIAGIDGDSDQGWASSLFKNLLIAGFTNDYGVIIGDDTLPDWSQTWERVDVRDGAGGMKIHGNDINLIGCNLHHHIGGNALTVAGNSITIVGGNFADSEIGIEILAANGISIFGIYTEAVNPGIKLSSQWVRGASIIGNHICTNKTDGIGIEIIGLEDGEIRANQISHSFVSIKAGYNDSSPVHGLSLGNNNYRDYDTSAVDLGSNVLSNINEYKGSISVSNSFSIQNEFNGLFKSVTVPETIYGNTQIIQDKKYPLTGSTHFESTGAVELIDNATVKIAANTSTKSLSGMFFMAIGAEMAIYNLHANVLTKLIGTTNTTNGDGNAFAYIVGDTLNIRNRLGSTQSATWNLIYREE